LYLCAIDYHYLGLTIKKNKQEPDSTRSIGELKRSTTAALPKGKETDTLFVIINNDIGMCVAIPFVLYLIHELSALVSLFNETAKIRN
jgi:hypothetical protein